MGRAVLYFRSLLISFNQTSNNPTNCRSYSPQLPSGDCVKILRKIDANLSLVLVSLDLKIGFNNVLYHVVVSHIYRWMKLSRRERKREREKKNMSAPFEYLASVSFYCN